MKIQIFCDPGHAWAKVPLSLLQELGIKNKITPYSYQRGDYAFLEEDCDLETLIVALRGKGIEPEWDEHIEHFNSPIRDFRHYTSDG